MLPENSIETYQNYVKFGWPPGSFHGSVLANDLRGAASHADHINKHLLFEHVEYLYNNVPAACWGSRETVLQWIEDRQQETQNG